jgi:hypothetical protein
MEHLSVAREFLPWLTAAKVPLAMRAAPLGFSTVMMYRPPVAGDRGQGAL